MSGNKPRGNRIKQKVTVPQLRILLKAIERNPHLYNVAKSDMISILNLEKWHKVTDKLNGCLDGAQLNTQGWKYVLRYWAAKVKKADNENKKYNKSNPAITQKEAKKLTRLEKRFYDFLTKEEAKEIVDVTYTGTFGIEQPTSDIVGSLANGIKVQVQVLNICEIVNDENTHPDGPKKRTIHLKEDNPTDPADVTKKLKIIYEEKMDDGEPQKLTPENRLDRLHMMSRQLEDHISTVQSRIHMIKDLWKHRCGDN